MKNFLASFLSVLVFILFDGCNTGGGEDGGAPGDAGIDISGSWSGEYVSPSERVSLSAKIRQSGNSIIIQTTKAGVGNLLTGTMDAEGRLLLIDAFDGETWTSYGAVTEHSIRIRDYLLIPTPGVESPEQDIFLRR